MTLTALRPRSTTEIVDAAVQLLRHHYGSLITIAAIVQLPVIGILVLIGPDALTPVWVRSRIGEFLVLFFIQGIASMLADAAIIVMVSEVYLARQLSVGGALGRAGRRAPTLIAAGFMRNIAYVAGLIVLIIPGFWVLVRLVPLAAVIMCEQGGASASFRRAWKLTEEYEGKVFAAMIVAWAVYLGLDRALVLAAAALAKSYPGLHTSGVGPAIGQLPFVFFYPLVSVVTTLVYYDLRVRKEGFDLEMLANDLAQPAVA